MDPRIKDVSLIDELDKTFEKVKQQLTEDEKRWGDTWKERGLVFEDKSQEERAYERLMYYWQEYKENKTQIPWEKVIGEAHICMVRDEYLK